MSARTLVEWVCPGRQQHRLFSLRAEAGGALVVHVHHRPLADLGSASPLFREKPGRPDDVPVEEVAVLRAMCSCSKSVWLLHGWEVARARGISERRVVVSARE